MYSIGERWLSNVSTTIVDNKPAISSPVTQVALAKLEESIKSFEALIGSHKNTLSPEMFDKLVKLEHALETGENIDFNCLQDLPVDQKVEFLSAIGKITNNIAVLFSTMESAPFPNTLNQLVQPPIAQQSVVQPKADTMGDMSRECQSLIKLMTTGEITEITNQMEQLLEKYGLIKANVIIMNALQNINKSQIPQFNAINAAVLEKKLAWLDKFGPANFENVQKEFEKSPNAIGNIYYNPSVDKLEKPDKRVDIKKSTVTLSDLRNCYTNKENPIQELCGTCGVISLAQALARDDISQEDFIKLMTCLNHYADLADNEYIPEALTSTENLLSREGMPGNKNLEEIEGGLNFLLKEEMAPLHKYIKKDAAVAIVKEYDHNTKLGNARLILTLNQGSEKYACHEYKDQVPLKNLQIKPLSDNVAFDESVATLGAIGASWDEFVNDAQNEAKSIWLVVPASEGHYIAVEQNTENWEINARESAEKISHELTKLEYVPIQFSCYGAAGSNLNIANGAIKDEVPNCKNLSEVIQAIDLLTTTLTGTKNVANDYVNSNTVLAGEYGGFSIDDSPLKKFIDYSKKLSGLVKKIGVSPENTKKLNLIMHLHKNGSDDPKVKAVVDQIENLMKYDQRTMPTEDVAELKNLYDGIDLEYIEKLSAKK